jgi:hypothetical protein
VDRRAAALPVLPLLLRSGAGPLAWHALGRESGPGIDELHAAFRLETLRARVRLRLVRRAVIRLREAGVEPIVGKGWAVARQYPALALRPFGDVDVYLTRRDAGRLRAFTAAPDLVGTDVHGGLSLLADRGEAEVVRRTRTAPLGRESIRVFAPEDHLRLLALHFLAHGAWRPLWLCDVALALERRPADFDWPWFLAGHARRTEAACLVLAAARELLGASFEGVPDSAVSSLPGWLLPSILRQWGRRDFVPQGRRRAFSERERTAAGTLRALRERWPDPVEATFGVGGSFRLGPRWIYQLAESARRGRRFVRSPRRLLRREADE